MKLCGIYKITSPTGKIYVGQSVNINKRKIRYKNLDCKNQPKLYNSLKKYTFEKHNFEILDLCIREELNQKERYWQEHFNVISKKGLNCDLTNDNNCKKIISEETKNKIRKSMAGRKHTKEAIKNMIKAQKETTHKNKKVINIKTKIIYDSIKKCAKEIGMSKERLARRLRGVIKNNTDIRYYEVI